MSVASRKQRLVEKLYKLKDSRNQIQRHSNVSLRKSIDGSQKVKSTSNSLMVKQSDKMSVNHSVIINPDSKWKTIVNQQEGGRNDLEETRKSMLNESSFDIREISESRSYFETPK